MLFSSTIEPNQTQLSGSIHPSMHLVDAKNMSFFKYRLQ